MDAAPPRTRGPERIVIPRIGGPEVLTFVPGLADEPGPGEVAIDVAAVGINFAEVFCRLGLYAAAPPRPFTPGFEVSGIIAAIGPAVDDPLQPAILGGSDPNVPPLAVGDRVFAVTHFGGYTTRLVVAVAQVRRFPSGWSMEEAAAFPVVFLTAYHGLVTLAHLERGETVVVQSAAGGVGTAACQLARALGARVIGTVGSARKREVARASGATEVVVTERYDAWDEIRHVAGDRGIDVVFDAVGGPGLRRAFAALRPGGRLIAYGFAAMTPRGGFRNWPLLAWRYLRTPRFSPFDLVQTNRTVSGFNLVHLFDELPLFDRSISALAELAARDEIHPVVGEVFPFRDVGRAHAALQSRQSTGKLVLRVDR